MVGFSLDVAFDARCLRCRRSIDPDTLRGCERVLQPESKPGERVFVVEKSGACPQCKGARVRVTMTRG